MFVCLSRLRRYFFALDHLILSSDIFSLEVIRALAIKTHQSRQLKHKKADIEMEVLVQPVCSFRVQQTDECRGFF
jgi:hypothetical protein